MLALDRVHIAGRGLDVDARFRRDVRHFFERGARDRELLFVHANLLVRFGFEIRQSSQLIERCVATRDQLLFFFGVERGFFRRDRKVFVESLQLRLRALALAAPLAQLLLRSARALLGDDAHVVRCMQLGFERLQLDRDAARARLHTAEV